MASRLGSNDLADLLAQWAATLTGSQAVGILLCVDGSDALTLAGRHDGASRYLDLFQLQANEGPSFDAVRTGRRVSHTDLDNAYDRWPSFAPRAAKAGVLSAHAFPFRFDQRTIGALNLLNTEQESLTPDTLRTVTALTDLVTIGIVLNRASDPHRTRSSPTNCRMPPTSSSASAVREKLNWSGTAPGCASSAPSRKGDRSTAKGSSQSPVASELASDHSDRLPRAQAPARLRAQRQGLVRTVATLRLCNVSPSALTPADPLVPWWLAHALPPSVSGAEDEIPIDPHVSRQQPGRSPNACRSNACAGPDHVWPFRKVY